MPLPIPTLREINVYDSLDERSAVEHFLGKDLSQAEALFRENFLYYSEDLMWMGPRAFCFYVQAAIAYLVSQTAKGDSSAVSSFCSAVEFRIEYDRDDIEPVHDRIREAAEAVLEDFPRFGAEVEIYGDLASRYRSLRDGLAKSST